MVVNSLHLLLADADAASVPLATDMDAAHGDEPSLPRCGARRRQPELTSALLNRIDTGVDAAVLDDLLSCAGGAEAGLEASDRGTSDATNPPPADISTRC